MLGIFLLQLQVQMKTSLEVMNFNMNATYEIRSQHIVDIQKTQFYCNKKIYVIHTLFGRIFFKIHYKTLKYLLN